MSSAPDIDGMLDAARELWAQMQRTSDPITRARLGSELLRDVEQLHTLAGQARRAALQAAVDGGMMASDVANAVGLTKGRVSQILSGRH